MWQLSRVEAIIIMLILKIRNWGMKRLTHCPRPLSRKCRARIQTKEEAVLATKLFCLSETGSPPPPAPLTWGRPHPYQLFPNPHAHSDPSPVVVLVSVAGLGLLSPKASVWTHWVLSLPGASSCLLEENRAFEINVDSWSFSWDTGEVDRN